MRGGTKRDGKDTLLRELQKLFESNEYVHYLDFGSFHRFIHISKHKIIYIIIYGLLYKNYISAELLKIAVLKMPNVLKSLFFNLIKINQ